MMVHNINVAMPPAKSFAQWPGRLAPGRRLIFAPPASAWLALEHRR